MIIYFQLLFGLNTSILYSFYSEQSNALYAVLKVAFLVKISVFNRCSDDKVLCQKLLLAQRFFP